MKVVDKFNGLNGQVVTRDEIEALIVDAKQQEQFSLVKRLEAVLSAYDKNTFKFIIEEPAIEAAQRKDLQCIDCELSHDDPNGLAKAVSPNDVYQMITDRMIEMIKNANSSDYKKTWKKGISGTGYAIPFNFTTKKRYRGVNILLLTYFGLLENPFFMTFKQVEEKKGKVRKGAKGHPVVYFTELHKVEDRQREIDFGSYDKSKAVDFAIKNGFSADDVFTIPILKYYNVFNGKDIEGIDFGLDKFKIGYIENEKPVTEKLPIAEAIVDRFPKPKVPIGHGGNQAYYSPGTDSIQMPPIADFDTVQDYYRTLFHELSHSTGHARRLERDFSGKFGSKKYAFEELIAEWGATFLSAEAGIIWHNNKNHAAYLKGWNSALTHIENDNRFVMRACTAAQKVADFVLQFNADGEPAYFADLEKIAAAAEKTEVKKTVIKKPTNKKTSVTKPTTEKLTKEEIQKKSAAVVKSVRQKRAKKRDFVDPAQTKLLAPVVVPDSQSETAVTAAPNEPETTVRPTSNSKYKTAADREIENKQPKELYKIGGDLAKFLGKIERKPVQSLAITLDSEEGGGKTHTVYQWANEFCDAGYRPIIWSLEEHATSALSTDKAKKYFGKNINCIPIESENSGDSKEETYARIIESINDFDVIIIDSWAKLMELNSKANFDQDFRKRFNGKLFIVIFQRTVDGSMRGGAKGAFDGDIILKGVVDRSNYQNNYIYNHKNRYNDFVPLSDLKYSSFKKGLLQPEKAPETQTAVPADVPTEKLLFTVS